ncbi:MAG: hypothetical protein J2P31_15730 [Blastocatellia bacterium]|nr:hypothetical protein [Blastocatellia bacterium]
MIELIMTAALRHKYVVVLGSCSTADALRAKNLEDIRGARLRLLWYQGRTSLLSMTSGGLESHEFTYTCERERMAKEGWELTMILDELRKRQPSRLVEVINMSDALIFDTVSGFGFPYLIAQPNDRYFLRSKDWERYVVSLVNFEQKWLWEIPLRLSLIALRRVLDPLYERQPNLRVIFHLPRPCFNDGVSFEDPQVTANVNYYHEYGERLYNEASRMYPRISVVNCGGERADPFHYNGPHPFHYDDNYMNALRKEIERLLD